MSAYTKLKTAGYHGTFSVIPKFGILRTDYKFEASLGYIAGLSQRGKIDVWKGKPNFLKSWRTGLHCKKEVKFIINRNAKFKPI